jgi:hypothetical protein
MFKPGSQNDQVLTALEKDGYITTPWAIMRGIYRLPARINDIRNEGYLVDTTTYELNGRRFAKYVYKS